ncbi:MAG: HU family DNA-binding protein [Oscillospiraceae bacterium]|nr:HU family DNA-binding protein [Oscillospiraceae bacterium]
MNKSELIAAAAQAAGVQKKDAERLLNAAIDIIAQKLSQGESVQLSGFGTFEVRNREARVGRNPVTRKSVEIPATKVPAFKASKGLKDLVGR